MQQILSVWKALSAGRRVLVVGATLAMFAAILAMSRMASQPNMALLYAGLESGAAGDVVRALEQRGSVYEVRGGGIFVPAASRDELRMTLAAEGLPENSNQGYELLDSLSGFGTTSQMFDAAYWRAKEGELARTIVSNPLIASARVHIANSSANPFQRDVTPSASISVGTTGAVISATQARALKYLVASAVPGLVPEGVAVIDGKGGLIGLDDESASGSIADDKADQLRDRVQRLVEARVGSGNAVVEVSVDTVTETESILERRFDPENRVVISSDTEERSNQSQDAGGGDVTVASNLPDGAGGGGDSSTSQNSETRERMNYEVSETTREITRAAGAIKRLTVAVLVNGSFAPNAEGAQVFVPLPETELTALRDLVASAVGYEESRGDAITIRSLAFEKPGGLGTEAVTESWFASNLDPLSMIQMGVLALVALILGLFVVRPIFAGRPVEALPATSGGSALALGDNRVSDALTGEIDPDDKFDNLPVLASNGEFGSSDFPGMGMVDFDGSTEKDPVERLRGLIDQRRDETVEILRSWLDDSQEVN
ncbi:flagellar basal-body MS-ring/collar protein FliF [Puniceibacterium sp. IMCC21224]|uniref:flagellar basal-body MS-ring/collar protein FliF n=1 Tax=Puniceibacterium sp. IMCC21224 TaxID=1618204 RepID=UPI00064E1150|nr:flagellar basal-body MS-ring/collar protein FliF [Puniceibacterium sp. IMCC21224]KMK68850.1 flagellar basal-body M-ring protein/flagellar hook-basal body protein FliF [Puniceibacterium sp. IMCC21224]